MERTPFDRAQERRASILHQLNSDEGCDGYKISMIDCFMDYRIGTECYTLYAACKQSGEPAVFIGGPWERTDSFNLYMGWVLPDYIEGQPALTLISAAMSTSDEKELYNKAVSVISGLWEKP